MRTKLPLGFSSWALKDQQEYLNDLNKKAKRAQEEFRRAIMAGRMQDHRDKNKRFRKHISSPEEELLAVKSIFSKRKKRDS